MDKVEKLKKRLKEIHDTKNKHQPIPVYYITTEDNGQTQIWRDGSRLEIRACKPGEFTVRAPNNEVRGAKERSS